MNPQSLLALIVPLGITVIGYLTPQINDFASHNNWVIPVYASVIQILNHFVTPVTASSAPVKKL